MHKFILVSFVLTLASCQRPPEPKILTTEERAENMFRKPAAEEQGKIKDKFQPIDHDIRKDPP